MRRSDDALLRALSHAERRRLLRMCMDKPLPVGELAADAGMALASVSEHLKVLRKTGLAKVEKRGKFWFYRTDRVVLEEVLAALCNTLLGEDENGQ